MIGHDLRATGMRQAGYEALIARFRLDVIPNWHQSFVATGNTHKVDTTAGVTREVYPVSVELPQCLELGTPSGW